MTIENDSKFLNIQPDVCEITAPKEKEKDKVCPTCTPDEKFVADMLTGPQGKRSRLNALRNLDIKQRKVK